ncbi:MAG TPA: phosphoribosylanthranilate isomerase [Bacteroidota bacterium]|nr:phosphoribosylanthranilate isomerase [Bacteroidota bacterium]
MIIKICGITQEKDALYASELGATALGFIFVSTSPRYIEPAIAADIYQAVKVRFGEQSPQFVGVFVNATRSYINDVLQEVPLDCIQFHGDELPNEIQGYSQRIWKAFRVSNAFQPLILKDYDAEACVLDTYESQMYGGTGRTFNWRKAVEAKQYCNVILSGGLCSQNIHSAIEVVQPYGIDVNSGVELSPGKKDHKKLELLFQELQRRK